MFGMFARRVVNSAAPARCTMMSSIIPTTQCQRSLLLNNNNNLPQIAVRHATKKAGGSSNNGRDSAGRRLGIKVWPGAKAKAGGIIVRQRGKKFLVGENVGMGNDHTVFALVAGRVRLTKSPTNRKRHFVHVDAAEV